MYANSSLRQAQNIYLLDSIHLTPRERTRLARRSILIKQEAGVLMQRLVIYSEKDIKW